MDTNLNRYSSEINQQADNYQHSEIKGDESSKKDKVLDLVKSTITHSNQLEIKEKTGHLSLSPDDKMEKNQINESINQVEDINKILQEVKEKVETSHSAQAYSTLVQNVVANYILKGGATAVEFTFPFILPSRDLDLISRDLTFSAEVVDIGVGTVNLIIKGRALQAAQEKIAELKKSESLTPEQEQRLKQLERRVEYENQSSFLKVIEIGSKITRFVGYIGTVLSQANTIKADTLLDVFGSPVIKICGAVYYGTLFAQARNNLSIQEDWSKTFKTWIDNNTLHTTVDDKTNRVYFEQRGEKFSFSWKDRDKIKGLESKIKERRTKQLEILHSKLGKDKVNTEPIKSKIKQMKDQGISSFLKVLNEWKEPPSLELFKEMLEERVGKPLNDELANQIYNDYCKVRSASKQTPLTKETTESITALSKNIKKYVEKWIDQQSDDDLLSTYLDYQSVIDNTVKSSIVKMVEKKHAIEKDFLNFNRTSLGIKLGTACLVAAGFLIACILSLVGVVFGPMVLILTLLTGLSTAVSIMLFLASNRYSKQQRPGFSDTLGMQFRLLYYKAVAAILSLKEKIIKNEEHHSWQDKSKRVDVIGQSLLSSSQPSIDSSEGEILSGSKLWEAKVAQLQEELDHILWSDFAEKAGLKVGVKEQEGPAKISTQEEQEGPAKTNKQEKYDSTHFSLSFDTLDALNQALTQGDLDLLNQDTRELIEQQLGVDLSFLQREMSQDPLAVKKIFKQFFNLTDSEYMKFIAQQATQLPK